MLCAGACKDGHRGGATGLRAGRGQVKCFHDERTDLALHFSAVAIGRGQVHGVLCAGEPHVEESALLLYVVVPFGQQVLDERIRQFNGLAAARSRETSSDESHEEHDRKLEALGLVNRQHLDAIRPDIVLLAGLTADGLQELEMLRRDLPVKYIIPDEGAIGWLDTWVISSGVEDVELAHKWVDFFVQERVVGEMTKRLGFGNTVVPAPGFDYADQLVYLLPPEDFEKRVEVYNEIKAEMVQ